MKNYILPLFLLIYSFGISQETQLVIEKLSNVNSTSDELMPVFSYDGKTMYFVRGFHPLNDGGTKGGQDIWFSALQDDSTWGTPTRFEKPLNNEQDNSVCGISHDGKTLYLDNIYDSKKRMHPGLSVSKQDAKGKWGKPETVVIDEFHPEPPFLEFSFPETVPNVLLISMENEDTIQMEDLYVAFKGTEGTWKKPVHMGAVLNTTGYEFAPYLDKDGKTLYFASNGHGGEGESDIFKSTRLDDSWTNWSEPENLGPQINSSGFEAYYTTDILGRAYFVSGNLSDGDDDIYMITFVEPEPVVVAAVDSVVVFKAPIVEPVEELPVFVESEYPFRKKFIVYFDYDKSILTAKSVEELKQVLKVLNEDPKRKINVFGHTCDLGNLAYNQKLSKQRAHAVLSFFNNKGIELERINPSYFGFSQPKVENDSDENRALNRRAEIFIYE